MLGKIILRVIIVGVLAFFTLFTVGYVMTLPHTFVGTQEFTNLSEAQQFHAELVSAAQEAGGEVNSFDLSLQSPLTATYNVVVPSTTFQYGHPRMETGVAVFFSFILVAFAVILGFLEIKNTWNYQRMAFKTKETLCLS